MKVHAPYIMALLAEAEARNALMESILTADERLMGSYADVTDRHDRFFWVGSTAPISQ